MNEWWFLPCNFTHVYLCLFTSDSLVSLLPFLWALPKNNCIPLLHSLEQWRLQKAPCSCFPASLIHPSHHCQRNLRMSSVRVSSSIHWFSAQSFRYESEIEHHWESLFKLGFWDRGDGHMERKWEPQWPPCCPRHLLSPSAELVSHCIFTWSTNGLWILYQEGCCLMNLCVPWGLT